jgi:hypothetical protein
MKVFPPFLALLTGDWQEKDREIQVGDLFIQRVDLLRFGILVKQGTCSADLPWRQQVQIYSRNDKSTRRKW